MSQVTNYADSFYIGDIPLNDNEDIYFFYDENKNVVLINSIAGKSDNEGIMAYRVFNNLQGSKLIYEPYATDVGLIKNERMYQLFTTRNWYDRPDCLNILFFTFCIVLGSIFIINIFTSIFKKGGLLGGLL